MLLGKTVSETLTHPTGAKDVQVVQPKERIESRHLKRRHMPIPADSIVDLIVYILQTTELARLGVGVPPVKAEGVKVGVRQQQHAHVAANRGQFVG